jgi:hypothetical protein
VYLTGISSNHAAFLQIREAPSGGIPELGALSSLCFWKAVTDLPKLWLGVVKKRRPELYHEVLT